VLHSTFYTTLYKVLYLTKTLFIPIMFSFGSFHSLLKAMHVHPKEAMEG